MKKNLVVFYSLTGTTRKLARKMAEMAPCDIEEIHETRSRNPKGLRGFVKSVFDVMAGRNSKIEELINDPINYDHIVIGTPVWAGQLASPIRAFFNKYNEDLKKVSFFCTYGGRGGIKTLHQMEKICGQPPHSSFAFSAEMIQDDAYLQDRLRDFVESWEKTTPKVTVSEPTQATEKKSPSETDRVAG